MHIGGGTCYVFQIRCKYTQNEWRSESFLRHFSEEVFYKIERYLWKHICTSCYITWKCTLTSLTAGRSRGSTSSLQRGLQVHTRVWLVFFNAVTGHLAVCNKYTSTTHVTFRAAQFLCNGNTTYECRQHPSIRVKLISISPDISEDKVTKSKRTDFNVREVCCTGEGDEAEEKSSVQIYRNDL